MTVKFAEDIRMALTKARDMGLSYALYLYPGDSTVHFIAASNPVGLSSLLTGDEFDDFSGFVFNRFQLSDSLNAYGIREEYSVQDILDMPEGAVEPQRKCHALFSYVSTDEFVYKAQAKQIIKSLESDNEKTVLSRVENISMIDHDPIDVAEDYFAKHASCFRFLFYTPESSIWMGASPELIIDYDRAAGELTSMSLAGTRPAIEDDEHWDSKNIMEHNMVTDYIVDVLNQYCTYVDQPRSQSVKFGPVEHICHMISARGDFALSDMLPRLTPTPALCGFPRERAYRQIVETESHRRMFYGGFVGVKTPDRARLYVNLRSAMVECHNDDNTKMFSYNLFGGGGLTAHSDPSEEYFETQAKMLSLRESICSESIW